VKSAAGFQKTCRKPKVFYLDFLLVLMNGWNMTVLTFHLFLTQGLSVITWVKELCLGWAVL